MPSRKVIVTSSTLDEMVLVLQKESAGCKYLIQGLIISASGDGTLQFFDSDDNANPLTNKFYLSDKQTITLNLRQFNLRSLNSIYFYAETFTEYSFTLIYEVDHSA
jgi:hypothetical protein